MKINRRKFVVNTATSAVGVLLGNRLLENTNHSIADSRKSDGMSENLLEEIRQYKKIDTHLHVAYEDNSPKTQLDFADRLGIDTMMISCYLRSNTKGTPEEFRKNNDLAIKCMKQHPDRFIGMMVLNPAYQKESLEEIERCLDAGMVGAGELYTHVKINDPLYYPVIERFIDLKMVMMVHSGNGRLGGVGNPGRPKNASMPDDFVDIAKRYPEQMFQFAHIAGGIDWEYACKALQHSQNIYVDISGSNNVANMVDFAMKYIGENRLLFATDNAYYQGIGRMIAANLTEVQRRKIFYDNYNKILKKSGRSID